MFAFVNKKLTVRNVYNPHQEDNEFKEDRFLAVKDNELFVLKKDPNGYFFQSTKFEMSKLTTPLPTIGIALAQVLEKGYVVKCDDEILPADPFYYIHEEDEKEAELAKKRHERRKAKSRKMAALAVDNYVFNSEK